MWVLWVVLAVAVAGWCVIVTSGNHGEDDDDEWM